MEGPKQVENQSQAEPKPKYEKPIIVEMDELTSGAGACSGGSGDGFCVDGPLPGFACGVGGKD